MSARRILKELHDLETNPDHSISVFRDPRYPQDIYSLLGSILGLPDSPCADGLFFVYIHLPKDYPFKPPSMRFITPVYNPNIDHAGHHCLDIFDNQWSPALTIRKCLQSLQCLLSDPNPSDPMAPEIAREMITSPDIYTRKAKEMTQKYAC